MTEIYIQYHKISVRGKGGCDMKWKNINMPGHMAYLVAGKTARCP